MSHYIFVNGEFFSKDNAKISVLDSGYQFGDGLFETMSCYKGKIIDIQKHMDRLFCSLNYFSHILHFSKSDVEGWAYDSIRKNKLQNSEAYLKIMVSRGGLGRNLNFEECQNSNIVILAKKLSPYPGQHYRQGINVVRSSIVRPAVSNPCYKHKLLNYFESIYAKNEALGKGATEALFLSPDNLVLEGSISNVFIVRGQNIFTPPLIYNILPGTTRDTVINICRKNKLNIREEKFSLTELYSSNEVFLTNSLMGVMPVRKIDNKKILKGRPGPITSMIMGLYASYLKD